MQANFNSDIPRLVRLTDEEMRGLSEYEKRKAMWLRYAFTKKRPTLEDADSGKDGARKCRNVCKDLKVIRRGCPRYRRTAQRRRATHSGCCLHQLIQRLTDGQGANGYWCD